MAKNPPKAHPLFLPAVLPIEMKKIEAEAIDAGCSEEHFMKEAGRKIALRALEWIEEEMLSPRVVLLVGKGNNGGDAYAAGIFLLDEGVEVKAYVLGAGSSSLNRRFRQRFEKKRGKVHEIKKGFVLESSEVGLILDGFLGTGFEGKIGPEMADAIAQAHASRIPILAIDIPSGLNGATGEADQNAVIATRTVALGLPKVGFFLRDGWNHTGNIDIEDFGLPFSYVERAKSVFLVPDIHSLHRLVPKIVRNRHKYQAGYVVGWAGSRLFQGAPKLSGLAALRVGAGIVRIFHLEEIGTAPMELICQEWNLELWQKELKRAQAVFLGPGLGSDKKCLKWLKEEAKMIEVPLVVDADALQPGIEYPAGSILTPHRGEVLRLLELKRDTNEEGLLSRCQKYAVRHGVVLVLKGAPTFIFSKGRPPVAIAFGNPGMATAGSGDVLTGILGGLLAQKIDPFHAAVLGASLHAIAGEEAAKETGSLGMIASDLIAFLPWAYWSIEDSRI